MPSAGTATITTPIRGGRRDVIAVHDRDVGQGGEPQAMQTSFDISFTDTPGEVTVRLSGEIDLAARETVVRSVVERTTPDVTRVVVDLAEVTFCDSSGLAALLDLKRHADGTGASLVLRDVPHSVARLLELADVTGWLAIE